MAKFVIGLDLGQADDWTALCVLGRQPKARDEPEDDQPKARGKPTKLPEGDEYRCSHLERVRGRSYPAIVASVRDLLNEPPLRGDSALVADRTGVGRAIGDMLEAAGLRPMLISIHGGREATQSGNTYSVPKADLVAIVNRCMGERRLIIGSDLPFADVLRSELGNFRYKLNPETSHEGFAAWREAEHDDLVLSLALALWWAEQKPAVLSVSENPFYGHDSWRYNSQTPKGW